jgi:SAM-dependent methyltransferase
MPPLRDAWDTGYRTRGRIWGGSPGFIPPLPASGRVLELGCGDGKTLSFLVSSGTGMPPGVIEQPASAGSLMNAPDAGLRGQPGDGSKMTPVPDSGISRPASGPFPVEIIGVDFSLEALCLCRGRTEFGPVRFVAADARCLPFRDGTCSLVLMLLSPGGSMYFAGFARGDMRAGKGVEVEPCTFRRNDGTITHYFAEDEVKELFTALNPVRVETRKWELRVRGVSHPRAEIDAWFTKEGE